MGAPPLPSTTAVPDHLQRRIKARSRLEGHPEAVGNDAEEVHTPRRGPGHERDDTPQFYARVRHTSQVWLQQQKQELGVDTQHTAQERCMTEQERLVGVLVGHEGVDVRRWPAIPRKMERLARHTVQRQDATEQLQHRLDHWDLKRMLETTEVSVRLQMKQQQQQLLSVAGGGGGGAGSGPLPHVAPSRTSPRGRKANSFVVAPVEGGATPSAQVQSLLAGLQQQRLSLSSPHHGGGHGGLRSTHSAPSLPAVSSSAPALTGSSSSVAAQVKKREVAKPGGPPRRLMLDGGFPRSGAARQALAPQPIVLHVEKVLPLVQLYRDACVQHDLAADPSLEQALTISLRTLDLKLPNISLTDAAARALGATLTACTHLQSLHILRSVLTGSSIEILLPCAWPLALSELHLSNTDIMRQNAAVLVASLAKPTCGLSARHPGETLSPPPWWTSLRVLMLGGNSIGDQGLAELLQHMRAMRGVEQLSLRQAGLSDWSAPQLEVIAAGTVTSLDLSGNSMGPLCCAALAAAVTRPGARLAKLDLSWNNSGGGSVHQLAWGLLRGKSSSLTSLDVSGSDLSQEDLMALAALLRFGENQTLIYLNLSHVSLLGVGGQCLLRQIDTVMPDTAAAAAQQTTAEAWASAKSNSVYAPAPGRPNMGRPGSARPGSARPGGRPPSAHHQRPRPPPAGAPKPTLQVITLRCRVAKEEPPPPPPAAVGEDGEGGSSIPTRPPPSRAVTPLYDLTVDLSIVLPDRYIAALLLEHEVAARSRQLSTWHTLVWQGTVYRRNGMELQPLDIMYHGWSVGLPPTGILQLGVAELPKALCHWLGNMRMSFNAERVSRKLQQEEEEGGDGGGDGGDGPLFEEDVEL